VGLGAARRGVGVLGRPVEEQAPLLQLPCGVATTSPSLLPTLLLPRGPHSAAPALGGAGGGGTRLSGLLHLHSNAEANKKHADIFTSP